jgi:predicted signal transduction protein with EAL and GGDEF domain
VARLGGDEFGLVLTGIRDEQTAVQLVEVVRARLGAELQLEGVALNVEASMGVALYPQHGTDIETLLRRADSAMYRGKRGTRSVMVAQPGAGAPRLPVLAVHAELRRALEADELVLHYQPKVALATGRTVGVEALVRWEHPERGTLGPAGFLPGVERSDLIGPFTTWVLRQALRDLVAWTAAGQDWTVAVNVSARNLETPGFVAEVLTLLREHAVEPAQVVLEITETALAGDASAVSEAVHALAARGVAVSIDDFGTGWSSLSQLRTLPVAEVKIDRTFVARLDSDLQDRAVVQSVVDLAHGLGCYATAEGVESQETADWLVASGCDQAQGYLWARPAVWQALLPTGPPTDLPTGPPAADVVVAGALAARSGGA